MRVTRFSSIIFILVFISACTSSRKMQTEVSSSVFQLRYIDHYVMPKGMQFRKTVLGGFSGIDYDSHRDIYYIISDDRSEKNPARFYKAKLFVNDHGIDSIQFIDVITMLDPKGNIYPRHDLDPLHSPDPESIRYDSITNQLVWGSEGERIVNNKQTILADPGVNIMDSDGRYRAGFELPANLHVQSIEKGPRRNGVFEGLSFSDDHRYLFASVEEPLYEDGPRAGNGDSSAWLRFIRFDVATKKPVTQYAYRVEPIAYPPVPAGKFSINGVSEILYMGNDQFIVLERSYSSGRPGNTIRLFSANAQHADDISNVSSLVNASTIRPITKKLLLNLEQLPIKDVVDNVEGMTFGPLLPNGHKTLVLVTDDNFSEDQRTQFFLFEIRPE